MKNRSQNGAKIDANIRPRAACARRGVLSSGCLLLYLKALSLKGTLSSHSSSALSLFIVCRRHLSLIWLRNNFLFMCWMECCAGYKQFRASFRTPFYKIFLCVFDAVPLPFSQTFFSCFFMLFTSLFSMLFR